MEIKALIQTKLPKERYLDICDFVEELYLADCALLILMARKFYNLFCEFHELNVRKYEKLNIPYSANKKIITNRALPLIEKGIKEGIYKKVIIADDIIIHGRSVKEICDKLLEMNPELDVQIMSYVRNNEENNHILDSIPNDHILPRYVVKTDDWRELSDEIVNTFYLSGRPYISYLPYFVLDITWNELLCKFQKEDMLSIQHDDMKRLGIEAFVYIGDGIEIFRNFKLCKVCGVRFYYYPDIPKIIAIPYCCLNDMSKDTLDRASDFLRTNFLNPQYVHKISNSSDEPDMRMIELEYVLSSWMAMNLFDSFGISIKQWVRDIEEYNFSERLLTNELSGQMVQENMRSFSQLIQACDAVLDIPNSDVEILKQHFNNLLQVYSGEYHKWKTCRQKSQSIHEYVLRILGHFESVNGNLDEEKCKNEKDQKRLFGLPVSFVLDQLAALLKNLQGGTLKENLNLAFAAVITVIDAGQATIVARKISETDAVESVIYAGEQNYKHHEIVNFPVMYGLYFIEEKGDQKCKSNEEIRLLKDAFIKRYIDYMKENSIFYIEGDIEYLVSADLKKEYGKFLRNSYKKHCQEPELQYAVALARSLLL